MTELPLEEQQDGWLRLSPRKLFLDPVKTLGQFLVPGLIALVGISSGNSSGRFWPFILPIMLIGPIAFGVIPWFTTYYRRTETQFQLRSGWLNKKSSTAPLDRIRSVDLEASLLHRILGLEKVQIGTGVDDERITLDALAREDAGQLRATLLRRTAVPPPETATAAAREGEDVVRHEPEAPAQLLASFDWSWLRFAPFSLTRLVIVAGAIGVLSQFGDDLPIWDEDTARSTWQWVTGFAIAIVASVLFLGALIVWLIISVSGYVVQWWQFRLTRESGSLHLTSGLLTTKSVTVEEAKIRGVELTEPVLLRRVGGAELSTLATGIEEGTHQVLPPCPRDVALSVGGQILTESEPMTTRLVQHGSRARRRSWNRHLRVSLLWPVAAILPVWYFDLTWWWPVVVAALAIPLGAVIGESSYRHLGHALTLDHLVAGSGDMARIRTVLETDGIIGWVFAQSWWQRRVGLANLIATTAAGNERVMVRDIPLDVGVRLADAATPDLLTAFLTP